MSEYLNQLLDDHEQYSPIYRSPFDEYKVLPSIKPPKFSADQVDEIRQDYRNSPHKNKKDVMKRWNISRNHLRDIVELKK